MKRLSTLALLLALSACAAARIPFHVAESSVFRFVLTTNDKSALGTAFVVPGMGSLLFTAGHNFDLKEGKPYITHGHEAIPVQAVKVDAKADIALIRTFEEVPIPEHNSLRWAEGTPQLGEPVTVACIPGAMVNKQFFLFTPGEVINNDETAWEPGLEGRYYTIASPAILLGCSGAPALNAKGEIVGMLVKGYSDGGVVNLIVPARVLKKFL